MRHDDSSDSLADAAAIDTAFGHVDPDAAGQSGPGADGHADPAVEAPERVLRVLVYSDDRQIRQQVMSALGRRPAADLPPLEFVEVATEAMAIRIVDAGGLDLLILDGEAVPAGGMGVCRQLKDEIYHCPPILVLIGRPQDAWLATWSRADGVAAHPIDAVTLPDVVTSLLRRRTSLATA